MAIMHVIVKFGILLLFTDRVRDKAVGRGQFSRGMVKTVAVLLKLDGEILYDLWKERIYNIVTLAFMRAMTMYEDQDINHQEE